MQITKIIALAGSTLLLSGCATIFSGTSQKIKMNVVDHTDNHSLNTVACTITDSKGLHHVLNQNPGAINVNRDSGTLAVLCKKPGYQNSNLTIHDGFNGVTLINILFWPGILIDGLSGAYKKYPDNFVIPMEQK